MHNFTVFSVVVLYKIERTKMCTNCEDLADLQWSKIEEPLSVNKAFIIGNHGPLHIG